MAELLSLADLCLGAGGSATWERCCLGVPAVVTIIAENQARTTRAVHDLGALLCLGTREEVDADALRAAVARLLGDPAALRTMSRASLALMAGARGIDEIVSSAFAD
jgi:UDP-2,4-diacetamido-2,4,6-trideoxy-beta-L-altropyranose hydrolase